MNFLYEQHALKQGAPDVAALTQQQKDAALATVGLAAVRWFDTQKPADLSMLRFAVCRFQTYDNLAREAELTCVMTETQGGAR